jgi:hypothetical protein
LKTPLEEKWTLLTDILKGWKMYKILIITVVSLVAITFGLSGCSQATAKAQDAPMGGHEFHNEEVLAEVSYDPSIDIDWPY